MRRTAAILWGVASLIAAIPVRAGAAEADRRPNILFIILDDWGWRDSGAYGATWIWTPTFDRIAREGVLFRHAFTSNPKCGPSRASILTGRHTWQLEEGAVHYSSFPSKFPVYPDLLEKAGYAVGLTGKGWGPGNFTVTGWPHNPAGRSFDAAKLRPPATGIMTTDYAQNFAQFLKTVKPDQPFCFWFGLHEPHRPYQRDSGLYDGRDPASVPVPAYLPDNETVRKDMLDYALEVEWADAQVGKALAMLESAGQLDNTLVVMTSDNGMPFPRVKGQIVEDDFHMPLAMRWGKIAQPGRVVDELFDFRDFAPTFLAAAGVSVPGTMSGRSAMDLLEKPGAHASRPFAMLVGKERHDLGRPEDVGYPVRAIRTQEWLYVRNYAPDRWPAGNPETNFPNCDDGPTKAWVTEHRDRFFELAFGMRPAESLYRVDTDPACLVDRARDPDAAATLAALRGRMEAQLREEKDPRVLGSGDVFDTYPWYGSRVHAYDTWLKKQAGRPAMNPASATRVPESLAQLKNSDVQWDHDYVGVEPRLSENARRVLATIQDEEKRGHNSTRKQLLTLLEEPDAFVVGHVLLGCSAFGEKLGPVTVSEWNGLKVQIDQHGKVFIDPAQRAAILNRWRSDPKLTH